MIRDRVARLGSYGIVHLRTLPPYRGITIEYVEDGDHDGCAACGALLKRTATHCPTCYIFDGVKYCRSCGALLFDATDRLVSP